MTEPTVVQTCQQCGLEVVGLASDVAHLTDTDCPGCGAYAWKEVRRHE